MAAGKSPRLSQEKEEEVRRIAQHRVECERKAFNVVVKLVECTSAEEGELEEVACYLTPDHYSDVIEERSISGLCGYPLCSNPLKDVPAQKYHISVQQKQIFDITERKKFCSSLCYKASMYYSSQLSDAPLWLRSQERPVKVTLIDHRRTSHLASSSRDVPFKESPSVATGDALAQTVKEKLCIEACSDTSHVEQDQRVDGGGLNEEDGKVQTTLACSSASTTLACTRTPENSLEDGVGCKLQPAQHTVRDTAMSADLKAATHSGTSVTKSTVQRYAQSSQSDSPLLRAYRVLSEWCEPETCQLLGEGWSERDVSQLRYVEASFVERQQQMDRTVNRADDSSQLGVCGAVKETQYLHDPVLPPVDSASQMLIRRRIVLQKILPLVQRVTRLAPHQVTSDVTALVRTFRLKANNISLGSMEWMLVTIVLLFCLARRSEVIAEALQQDHFRGLLHRLKLTEETLAPLIGVFQQGHDQTEL